MKQLIITEKPSVAGDLAKALGGFTNSGDFYERDDAIIAAAAGHLVELEVAEAATAPRGFAGLPILPVHFGLRAIPEKSAKLNSIGKLLKRADVASVMNACDAGREGELIFALIMEHLGCQKPMTRMWAQTMTPEGLREAYVNARPASERYGLVCAAKSRSEGDWLIGINGSRACTELRSKAVGVRESQNVGRVQTPTLAIVVHREWEIQKFKSQLFWEVGGLFNTGGQQYKGKLLNPSASPDSADADESSDASASKHRFFDKAAAQALLDRCQGASVDAVTQEVTDTLRAPPTLFDLTTLQREANTRFKFTAKKTLEIAQRLYEKHKMTTYPRTDSIALPEDYVDTVKQVMQCFAGSPWDADARAVTENNWVNGSNKRVFNNEKISDHFAIIPTGHVSALDADEQKIFDLITRRFIAAFYPAAKLQNTKRITTVAGLDFLSRGTVIVDPGWMRVIKETDSSGNVKGSAQLCPLAEGQKPSAESIQLLEGKTSPPGRFTEAALLAAMEAAGKTVEDDELRQAMKDRGLGTPATRAATIEGLCDDGSKRGQPKEPYLRREDNRFIPTKKAMELIEFLESNGAHFLTSAATTGEWEYKLSQMDKGNYERTAFMAEICDKASELVDILRAQEAKIVVQSTPLNAPCPKCKAPAASTAGGFLCSTGCGFSVPRMFIGRVMSDQEMTEVLNGKTVGLLKGFYSKAKDRKFDAYLKLGEGKLEFVFPGQDGAPVIKLKCKCPKCDGDMVSKPKVVECAECEFLVFRNKAKRDFTDAEFEVLLSTGKLPVMKGFKTGEGKAMEAGVKLSLEDGKVELVFPGSSDMPYAKLDANCPKCKSAMLSKPKGVECEGCKLFLFRTIAKRNTTDKEFATLLKTGHTGTLNGFVSTKGKSFPAKLRLNTEEWKVDMVLEPRK